jgi:amino-acid N-acetyltransferase
MSAMNQLMSSDATAGELPGGGLPPALRLDPVDVAIRQAQASDAPGIHRLICAYREAGHLLPRRLEEIALHAPRFIAATLDERLIGCGELAPLSGTVGEVRSLVVDEGVRGIGLGSRLVDRLIHRARLDGLRTVCAFTHRPEPFLRLGFSIVPHVWVPEKIAADCRSCAAFRRCGQHAMVLPLGGRRSTERDHQAGGTSAADRLGSSSAAGSPSRWPLWLHV